MSEYLAGLAGWSFLASLELLGPVRASGSCGRKGRSTIDDLRQVPERSSESLQAKPVQVLPCLKQILDTILTCPDQTRASTRIKEALKGQLSGAVFGRPTVNAGPV